MLSRMVNSTSSSRNLADQCPDDTLDWMFDVDTADAAMARAQPSGPRGGRGGAASRGASNGGRGAARSGPGGGWVPPPLGLGGHTSMSVNDFSTIAGNVGEAAAVGQPVVAPAAGAAAGRTTTAAQNFDFDLGSVDLGSVDLDNYFGDGEVST